MPPPSLPSDQIRSGKRQLEIDSMACSITAAKVNWLQLLCVIASGWSHAISQTAQLPDWQHLHPPSSSALLVPWLPSRLITSLIDLAHSFNRFAINTFELEHGAGAGTRQQFATLRDYAFDSARVGCGIQRNTLFPWHKRTKELNSWRTAAARCFCMRTLKATSLHGGCKALPAERPSNS